MRCYNLTPLWISDTMSIPWWGDIDNNDAKFTHPGGADKLSDNSSPQKI